MIRVTRYTYSEDRVEYLEFDESNFDDEANEESATSGYWLSDQELADLRREYFEAAQEMSNYEQFRYESLEDYEKSKQAKQGEAL